MKTIKGNYITIDEYNEYFSNITIMLLEHYDTPELKDVVIVLGSYIQFPIVSFRLKYPGKKIIVYQMEQMVTVKGDTWHNTKRTIENIKGADEIWDYDKLNIKYLEEYYGIKVDRFVPMRYTQSLDKEMKTGQEDIDLLFYGQLFGRRLRIIQKLEQSIYGKVKFAMLFGINRRELDSYIERAKVILNIHAFEPYHRQEQQRMFYPIINGKCVLSEVSQENYLGNTIVEAYESTLVPQLLHLLEKDRFREFGLRAKEKFRKGELI